MTPPARILVVHDEPALGELLVRLLHEAGYAAQATTDGPLIWRTARANGAPFELLITNCFLPELPSSEVLTFLAREYPGAPILHLDTLQSSRHDGCSAALFTPFCRDLFLAEVQRLLAFSEPRQSA